MNYNYITGVNSIQSDSQNIFPYFSMLLNDWPKWKIVIKVVVRQIRKVAISHKTDEDSPVLFAYTTSKEL